MNVLRNLLDRLPLSLLVIASLTLGLAPFVPEPHVWEKLKMLAGGDLTRPIDDSRARAEWGWQPTHSLERIIEGFVAAHDGG